MFLKKTHVKTSNKFCHFIISNTVFKENAGVAMELAQFRSA